jgi:hypothetical protein
MRQGLQRRLQRLEAASGAGYSAEHPRKHVRFVVTGTSWTPIPGKHEAWSIGTLDLAKSTCKRTLGSDGILWEWVKIHGDSTELSDEELERWIATHPVERVLNRK